MEPGQMDRRVTLQEFTAASPAQNAHGEPVGSWTTFATVWAGRRDDRGTEVQAAQGQQAERFTVWKVRWLAGVHERMRVLDDEGTTFAIQRIARLGRKEALELYCRAVNPEATSV